MDSKEITVTDARLLQALETPISHVMSNSITPQINKVANDLKIKTGRVTKYYQYLDRQRILYLQLEGADLIPLYQGLFL